MDIITYEQAWRDQEDLDDLCRESIDYEAQEKFDFNEAYGFADVLKQYSGYPEDRPIEAVVPHGVYLNASHMLEPELRAPVPAVLNYPAFRAQIWQDTDKVIIPAASPFLYALTLFREHFEPRSDAQGTIFFPAHTIQGTRVAAKWDSVAEELLALDDTYQPITVCIRTRDYNEGLHLPFSRRGFRVVSAGVAGDSQFLYRWLHLLSSHQRVVSNDVGSAVFFAAKAGMPVRLLDELAEHVVNDPTLLVIRRIQRAGEGLEQARETRERIASLIRRDGEPGSDDLRATIDYLLGAENFKSPNDLKADLEYAASLVSR